MVGPQSDEDKRDAMNQFKAGVVLLVGVSAGLIAFSGGATLLEAAVAVGAGLLVGAALLAYLVRIA
ncbi:hypothetical protein M0R88_01320 [Halorussus gelatinilyticus]|uniref:Uncharacterized protein n=1 Tax=Halorussus gelatinilyticus TaxID=2937524 RepID=A0A8U0II40_9EURY|nr:hypothetical protein [Halorussus gelatinilyticus]UPW00757.1 hypothetical protein M0R88_01320 [Halorussus gelatinilyticus]